MMVPQFAYLESQHFLEVRTGLARKTLRLRSSDATASPDETRLIVHDFSATGLLVEGALALSRGEEFDLLLPGQGTRLATVVWISGSFFGCQFAEPIGPERAKAALPKKIARLPKKDSPEAISLAAFQLHELSLAVDRIGWVLERVIFQLSKRNR